MPSNDEQWDDLMGAFYDDDDLGAEDDDDLAGDDDDDEMGRKRRRRRRSRGRRPSAVKVVSKLPLGLGTASFTNASTSTAFTFSAEPQRTIKLERLVADIRRSAGAASIQVLITDIKVGQDSQLAGAGAIAADIFAPNAVRTGLRGSVAGPGLSVTVTGNISALPAVGESVDIALVMLGDAKL